MNSCSMRMGLEVLHVLDTCTPLLCEIGKEAGWRHEPGSKRALIKELTAICRSLPARLTYLIHQRL